MKIGTVTKEQIIKSRKKHSREMELEQNVGLVATTKVHKSLKDYSRKPKYKRDYSVEQSFYFINSSIFSINNF